MVCNSITGGYAGELRNSFITAEDVQLFVVVLLRVAYS